eukprot:6208704-Pleurochrysis_carterae.AAC.3
MSGSSCFNSSCSRGCAPRRSASCAQALSWQRFCSAPAAGGQMENETLSAVARRWPHRHSCAFAPTESAPTESAPLMEKSTAFSRKFASPGGVAEALAGSQNTWGQLMA